MIAVQLAAHPAEHGAEPPHERCGQRFEDRDLEPAQAARGRDLGADEPRAHDHDPRRGIESAADGERVFDRAQHEQAVEIRSAGKHAGRAAGREHEAVERDAPPSSSTTARRRGRGSPPACRAGARARGRRRAARRSAMSSGSTSPGEELLRQRRAVVGKRGLGPDEDESAVEALAAQGLRGPEPGERRPDHGHRLQRHARFLRLRPYRVTRGTGFARPRTRIDPCPGGVDKGRRYGAYLA